MRKQILSAIYLCLFSIAAQAQDEENLPTGDNNIIKANLSALVFRNLSIQYEIKDGKKASVALSVNAIPYGKVPFQSLFKKITENSGVQSDMVKVGRLGVVAELRFYLGKEALQGFYLAPFLGYSNYHLNLPLKYSSKIANLEGNVHTFNAGLQLGAQFNLGKNFMLDCWIIGPNIGSASGTLDFTGALNPTERNELKNVIEDLKKDLPFKIIQTYFIGNNTASIVTKGAWPGLRGLGLSLGYRF